MGILPEQDEVTQLSADMQRVAKTQRAGARKDRDPNSGNKLQPPL